MSKINTIEFEGILKTAPKTYTQEGKKDFIGFFVDQETYSQSSNAEFHNKQFFKSYDEGLIERLADKVGSNITIKGVLRSESYKKEDGTWKSRVILVAREVELEQEKEVVEPEVVEDKSEYSKAFQPKNAPVLEDATPVDDDLPF